MLHPRNFFFLSIKFILFAVLIISILQCSARFVKKEELGKLKKEFDGVYVLTKPVDIGNNKKAEQGIKVRLYFFSASDSIKVYAYPHTQPRESALGENVLLLFDSDFPKEAWDKNFFKKKLFSILKKIK